MNEVAFQLAGRLWSKQETDMQTKLGQRVKHHHPCVYLNVQRKCLRSGVVERAHQGCRSVALTARRCVWPPRREERETF